DVATKHAERCIEQEDETDQTGDDHRRETEDLRGLHRARAPWNWDIGDVDRSGHWRRADLLQLTTRRRVGRMVRPIGFGQLCCTGIVLGLAAACLGSRTRSTPLRDSAWTAS